MWPGGLTLPSPGIEADGLTTDVHLLDITGMTPAIGQWA